MISSYLHAVRGFSRDVRLYLVTAALMGFTAWGGIFSTLANLFLLRLGYGPQLVGLVSAVGSLGFALFSLMGGMAARRWSARRACIAGLALVGAGQGLYPFAEFVPHQWQIGWLLAAQLLAALGSSTYAVAGVPFLMGASRAGDRNYVFAVQAALWPMAAFAGSVLAGLLPGLFAAVLGTSLDSPAPFRFPLWISAATFIVAVLAMRRTHDPEPELRPATEGTAVPLRMPTAIIALMSLVIFLQASGEGAARTFFNVYLDQGLGVPTAQIGLLAGLAQLVGGLAALLTPLLVARMGNGRTFIWMSLGMALAQMPLALVASPAAAGAGYMGLLALVSISRPAGTVYNMEIISPAWRATMSGVTTMALGLSWGMMNFAGGFVIATRGYPAIFLIGAVLTAAGALLFAAHLYARERRERGLQAQGEALA
jgi:MFS family permease